jgi:23S rRNA pseudouridine2605 synthase
MSRRAAEQAIAAGRVHVNGVLVTEMGLKVTPHIDRVEVDGKPVSPLAAKLTLAFNKPRLVMCTRDDPEGRPTVMHYFKENPEFKPVGRLDFESEGLLLMSSDGDVHFKITHPKFEAVKKYFVTLARELLPVEAQQLMSGVTLEDGSGKFLTVRPAQFQGFAGFEVEVGEGRNRFIRKMFEAQGNSVQKLVRLSIGPIQLGLLDPGKVRSLTESEVAWIATLKVEQKK